MPITVQYGPASLMGTLATRAGEARGQQIQHQWDMDSARLSLQARAQANQKRAQDRAFQLQMATADKMLAARLKTPAADHMRTQADVARAEQQKVKDQLDKLAASGSITPEVYQKSIFGLLSGNKALITELLKPVKPAVEKPNISRAQEVDIIRKPFQERREVLGREISDPITSKKRKTELQKRMQDQFDKEATAVSKWREEGPSMYEAAPRQAPRTGGGSVSFTPEMSASEQNILRFARGLAGEASSKIGGDQPVTQSFGSPAPPVVVRSDEDYAKLPSGENIQFIGPDGVLREKP